MQVGTEVFLVTHTAGLVGSDLHLRIVGIYPSEQSARESISRLRNLPGFLDAPESFRVETYYLGVDRWSDGFVDAGLSELVADGGESEEAPQEEAALGEDPTVLCAPWPSQGIRVLDHENQLGAECSLYPSQLRNKRVATAMLAAGIAALADSPTRE